MLVPLNSGVVRNPSDTYVQYLGANSERLAPPASSAELEEAAGIIAPFTLPGELGLLYSVFNGETDRDGEWLSLSGALEERQQYKELFEGMDMEFPDALLPIYRVNGGSLFTILGIDRADSAPVLAFYAAEGDSAMYLEYDSVALFVETLLRKQELAARGRYPETEGHYADPEQRDQIEAGLNPNRYSESQSGEHSGDGVRNVFHLYDLPSSWYASHA